MIGLSRLVQRIIENPKLLIAIGVLIAFGIFCDYILTAPGNPLPDADQVRAVSFFPGHGRTDSPGRPVHMPLYRELCEALGASERVLHSGTGELTGTILIRRTDGSATRARVYEWGMVQTEDGLFMCEDSDEMNRLSAAIRRIGDAGTVALR